VFGVFYQSDRPTKNALEKKWIERSREKTRQCEQKGDECGFGHNVRADGTFRKISNRTPKFDDA